MDDETFERIPWEHLSASGPKRNPIPPRHLGYGLAGLAAIAALFFVFARSESSPPSTTEVVVIATTTSLAEASTTSLLTEEALMAVPNVADEAASWAEWITETYLTVDGSASTDLAELLPAGSALPAPVDGQRVFVESARTIAVAEEGNNYRAVVLARLLAATGDAPYERLPDRALAWTLRWESGGWVVVDLPEEVTAPQLRPGPPFAAGPVPEPILSAATKSGTVLEGTQVGDLWRVVVAVADRFGGSWPVVFWFAPDGSPVPG